MDLGRQVVCGALALGLSGCDIEPAHTVPEFTAGGGGTGEATGGEETEDDDGGPLEGGPLEGGPVDDGADDDAEGDDSVDSGGGVDGGPLDDDGGTGGADGATTGPPVDPPPFDPLYRINVRIHAGGSNLTDAELTDILNEMNFIWRSQAAVCFEFEVVNDDATMTDGFDMWFQPEVGGPNGYYSGDHDIYVRDEPNLGNAPNPAMIGAARTAAHELGHGLTLDHDQGSDDYLMRSGTYGWDIPMYQIDESRLRAAQKALADTTPLDCGAPVFL